MKAQLTGLIAAVVTPMHADGSLNLELVPDLVNYLLSSGISGIFVCGSTGEGLSLTGKERRIVAESFIKAANNRLPVIVQVGHNSIRESMELSAHAEEAGADAIASTPPSYFKPERLEILVQSMYKIAGSAPSLPFYYYHIPSLTGVRFDMADFLKAAAGAVPNLAGIKFSEPTLHEFQSCLDWRDGEFDMLWGCDGMLLGALAVGARGAIGSTFNALASLYLQMIDSFSRQDLESARRYQSISVEFVRILSLYASPLASLKAVMKLIGLDCGDVRLPLQPFPLSATGNLSKALMSAGLMEWLGSA